MPDPDPRWRNVAGGISLSGQVEPMTQAKLEELADEWAGVVAEVPPFGGTELLKSARSQVVQAWWDYEFMVTGCLIGFQAVEATFRLILYPEARSTPLRRLVDRAQRDGWLNAETADKLRAGVDLRNRLSHPHATLAFSLGMADSVLRVCHIVVRDICAMRGLETPPQPGRTP